MPSSRFALRLLSTCALLLGCGDSAAPGGGSGVGGGGAGGAAGQGLPCDVAAVLANNCQTCHAASPVFGAPMSLVSRADLLAKPPVFAAPTVGEAIVTRTADGTMPPPPNPLLSAADQALLADYVAAGMPESAEICGGDGGGGAGGGYSVGCEPDLKLAPAAPFEMPADQADLYVCFGVEGPNDLARQITAITPKIDNSTIVHHILFMQSPTAVTAQGEPCNFTNIDWKLLYAWAPGAPPLVLPEEAGYPFGPDEPGHFVIQVHYNNINGLSGEQDQSGIDLCTTTELRPYDADIMAFGGTSFSLPPNQTSTVDCTTPVPGAAGSYFPVTLFQSWPHMHQIGSAFTSEIVRADNSVVSLASVPNYDFDSQVVYPVAKAQLDVGDKVRTRCTFTNTTGSPVSFGEDTADEMCFNFVGYYPRVTAPTWSWLLPAYTASCQTN